MIGSVVSSLMGSRQAELAHANALRLHWANDRRFVERRWKCGPWRWSTFVLAA